MPPSTVSPAETHDAAGLVAPPLDPDVIDGLKDVLDPEVGLSVVDLGLVYEARRTADAVTVALTLTARACPLGEMILEDARDALAERFPDVSRIDVALVWDPPWDPDRITDRGLALLGRPPRSA
ncbi:metal-sulfur cluster assembly factor [Rhodoplanes sp. TEM]|uniref:Metal-sulfur cluster assembly factor n=1 Tax=Rhodoplanes tepidamans TaxID=200616 RepID=A0ABT5J6L8_RHOTP|nr:MULTISPECIES: metal-sulfur cluster assembly factor [Rhodoplanes]MDC7785163.1 metal-sulfur cluster assembly factor [Rhodoplanes tepidamans]MDC7982637.1 metal-sulfur cluster assembly factor [Rhodoplanes sp. TEM]MDQ0356655.1 metal-sulfur cluster biosynthetic enzyme [Rhodoplanes tepidamans]